MIQTIKVIAAGGVDNIDNTPPKITEFSAQASETEASVTVALEASDAQSGIKTINWLYQKDGGSWQSVSDEVQVSAVDGKMTGQANGPFTHEFASLDENTNYKFKATVTDVATNKSQESDTKTAHTTTTSVTPTTDIIGDYVNYPIDINGNDKTTDDWRVFYVGQDVDGEAKGRIFLIAADCVAHTCDELAPALMESGMTNLNYTDNNYETCYWLYAPGFNCYDKPDPEPTVAKTQCSFPDLFMPNNPFCSVRYFCSDHMGNANSQCASKLQCTKAWGSFVKGDYADLAIGGPTINMWIESWNARHGSERKLYANGIGNNGYCVGNEPVPLGVALDLSKCQAYGDTLYFTHRSSMADFDGDTLAEYCQGYWVASPSNCSGSDVFSVGFDGYLTGTQFVYSSKCGVRPIVCLKSTAKLKDSKNVGNRVYSIRYR